MTVKARNAMQSLVGVFMCLVCGRCFSSAAALGRHEQATGHGVESTTQPVIRPRGIRKRHRYSFRRKRDVLVDLLQVTTARGNAKRARDEVSARTGISTSNLEKWMKQQDKIFSIARIPVMAGKAKACVVSPRWPEAEMMLYLRFIYRRRYQAVRTKRSWLKRQMKECRRKLGDDVEGWHASEGWCSKFCKRWQITAQCRTNKKRFSIEERLPAIQEFHQNWIYGVQRSGKQRCPKYGQFPATHIYSQDQVPMPFSSTNKTSMNEKGSKRGNRFTGASEDDKRFCTLNITICAAVDHQDVPIEIIFRSESEGQSISQVEKDFMIEYPSVKIRWQPSAWADEDICMDYIRDFRVATVEKGDVALVMDQHSSQHTPLAQTVMYFLDIKPIFTPANCTDCVSPVDRNVGVWIKNRIFEMQEEEMCLARNRDWSLPANKGGLTVSQKRMLIVRWVATAWEEMKRNRQRVIRSAFVDTGVLVAKDGSENDLIRLWPDAPLGMYNY